MLSRALDKGVRFHFLKFFYLSDWTLAAGGAARMKLHKKRGQVSAQPPAKTTAGLIDEKN